MYVLINCLLVSFYVSDVIPSSPGRANVSQTQLAFASTLTKAWTQSLQQFLLSSSSY